MVVVEELGGGGDGGGGGKILPVHYSRYKSVVSKCEEVD